MKMKYYLGLLLFIMIISSQIVMAGENTNFIDVNYTVGQVYWSHDGSELFVLQKSVNKYFDRCKILTFSDGQAICEYDNKINIRLKQDSGVETTQTDYFHITKGTVGVRTSASSTVCLSTPKLEIKLYKNSIVVVKETPVITRVCLVKGKALIEKDNKMTLVNKGFEIAASNKYLSKTYKKTAELRFTWYWTTYDKEPCLR